VVSTVPGTVAGIQLVVLNAGVDSAVPLSFTLVMGAHFQPVFNS
jgi:hypothetical protein